MTTERRKKILIVDDDQFIRSILKRGILIAGYDVVLASNGQEALQKIQEETPDLIVLDLMMPGMNGFELCRRIRSNEQTAKTPVIVLTALRGQADSDEAKASGADMFLTKPIKSEDLINHVKSYLGSPFKAAP